MVSGSTLGIVKAPMYSTNLLFRMLFATLTKKALLRVFAKKEIAALCGMFERGRTA